MRKKAFFVGIKGVGMANLALLMQGLGWEVVGSDLPEVFITDPWLKKAGVRIHESFDPGLIEKEQPDLVIYTGAHQGKKNPQVLKAFEKGLKVKHASEVIADLMKSFSRKLLIAGTHGKTTTTCLSAAVAYTSGFSFSSLAGTSDLRIFKKNQAITLPGGIVRGSDLFILEADEYAISPPSDLRIKFLLYEYDYLIIPSVDFDHPDVYKDFDQVLETFERLILKNPKGKIFLNIDDKGVRKLLQRFKKSKKDQEIITYGRLEKADYQLISLQHKDSFSDLRISLPDGRPFELKTRLLGEKNALNTLGVFAFYHQLPLDLKHISEGIFSFAGLRRRLESYGKSSSGIALFDDYAHHPTEIEAVAEALKSAFPKKKILYIFQPHTYSRTQALQQEFIKVFQRLDYLILLPIFASAREDKDKFQIKEQDLIKDLVDQGRFFFAPDFEEAKSLSEKLKDKIDIIITLGAGDIYKLLPELRKL